MLEERKKLLKAALDEFAEVGLKNSSLESISDRAKLEPAVARALFVDKETLLRDLLKEETEPLVSATALAVQELDDPRELIRKSMELLDQWLLTHPEYIRLLMRCSLEGGDVLQSLYQHSLLPSEFYERLEQIIGKGQFRCNDIFMLSLLLDSLIVFLHVMRPVVELMSPGQSVEQITEQRFEAVMDLLENGLFSEKVDLL